VSATEQMLSAVAGTKNGRSVLEGTIPFTVVLPVGPDETIWAHAYTIIDGCLQFVTMKSKNVEVPDDKGGTVTRTAVYQTYPETFAAGTWSRVKEVFVPEIGVNQIAN